MHSEGAVVIIVKNSCVEQIITLSTTLAQAQGSSNHGAGRGPGNAVAGSVAATVNPLSVSSSYMLLHRRSSRS